MPKQPSKTRQKRDGARKLTKVQKAVGTNAHTRKRANSPHYTDEEKKVILAQLAANGYNYSRTAKETGVARSTLLLWEKNAPDTTVDATEIDTLKKQLTESYLNKTKRAREVLLDRIIELAQSEKDLFKVSGAFKTVADAAASEEVNHAVASRIRGHSAATESASAQGTGPAGGPGSTDPAFH